MLSRIVTDLRAALMLLTRLPVSTIGRAADEGPPPDLSASVWAYPAVGFLVGSLAGLVFVVASLLAVPTTLAAILAVTASVLITGAFHEDGLADTADGLGGGRTLERKLEIMRDSRIGTYGTIAITLSLAIRISALSGQSEPVLAAGALATIGALSRGSILVLLAALSPARTDGLGAVAGAPTPLVTLVGLAFALAPLALWPHRVALALFVAAGIGAALIWRLARNQLGGTYTGDLLGAGQQISSCLCWIAFVTV